MNTLRIRKLGVLSVAKMYGVICLVIGLLIGIMYGVFFIIYGFLGASMVGGNAALAVGGGSIVVGVLFMIGIPLMYGAFGFVGGAIGALLYNVFSHFVGGIEIEVDRLN
jgi:hypothetical protein